MDKAVWYITGMDIIQDPTERFVGMTVRAQKLASGGLPRGSVVEKKYAMSANQAEQMGQTLLRYAARAREIESSTTRKDVH